jgi:hypothetical protein
MTYSITSTALNTSSIEPPSLRDLVDRPALFLALHLGEMVVEAA